MLKEFRDFLIKTNALALAVGVIIGAAVGKVVGGLVDNILMPLIGLALPGGAWREAKIVLSSAVGADGKTVENAIHYGTFMGNVIDFIIIAFVVYMMTKALIKEAPVAPPPPSKTCGRCKESVAVDATKCKFCTADI